MRRFLFVLCAGLAVPLVLAFPASAKDGAGGGGGGNGGGGGGTTTTTSVGASRDAGGTAVCDHGTVISVSLRKGFNKRVEARIVPLAEGTNPDGSPAGQSWWNQRLVNDTSRASVGSWGANISLSPGLVQTILLGSVPVGTSQLTYTATRKQLTGPNVIDLVAIEALPVVETCSVTITVTAK